MSSLHVESKGVYGSASPVLEPSRGRGAVAAAIAMIRCRVLHGDVGIDLL